MSPRDRVMGTMLTVAIVGAVLLSLARRGQNPDVNPNDPAAGRIDTFGVQPGEVGVALRVRHGQQPVDGATVWVSTDKGDEDDAGSPWRKGSTDHAGLARVPVLKAAVGSTHVFVRDSERRVGGVVVQPGQIVSAPDVQLRDVAPRRGRLQTADGKAVVGATLTAQSFATTREGGTFVAVPEPLEEDYTAVTDSAGGYEIPGVPVGSDCWVRFKTSGYGEGTLHLPAASDGVFRLEPAGTVWVRVAGEGSAADAARMLCDFQPVGISVDPAAASVDGRRSVRHDGLDAMAVANLVPGEYRLSLVGTPRHAFQTTESVRITVKSSEASETVVGLRHAGRLVGRTVDAESGEVVAGVRLQVFAALAGGEGGLFSGRVRTDDNGEFSAYVPPSVPVQISPDRTPRGYHTPRGAAIVGLMGGNNAHRAAAGETQRVPDIRLYRQGTLTGVVEADGHPVADAVVEARWDAVHFRPPVTVRTDGDGRFRITDAPPDAAVGIRVRAGGRVNARVVYLPHELTGPVRIPIAAESSFRIRGRAADGRGRPVAQAKAVISCVIARNLRQPTPGDKGALQPGPETPQLTGGFQPAEVEAVFTDGDGGFESGPLWPECYYTVTVSADRLVPEQLGNVEGKAGVVHDASTIRLLRTDSTVAGVVVGPDGGLIVGATVVQSGDGTRRASATTDADGRFRLDGLFDGPAVVVAHKEGYHWAYVVNAPDAEARVVLYPQATPRPVPAVTEAHRQAEQALRRRLEEIERRSAESRPKGPNADPWADALKDLDGYVAKLSAKPTVGVSQSLVPLADVLAKTDPLKARRVLREAANLAKRATLPDQHPAIAFVGDFSGTLRVMELTNVASAALRFGMRQEAAGWLEEAEGMARQLPEAARAQPIGQLAEAWARIDPDRAEKLFDSLRADEFGGDFALLGATLRVVKSDPAWAVRWLDRFKQPREASAQSCRVQVAVSLAARDWDGALAVAAKVENPVYRCLGYARLAGLANGHAGRAREMIDSARAALAAAPESDDSSERESRTGAAIYLLWEAKKAGYPDIESLVALAMTARPPVQPNAGAVASWRAATLRLAAGVASIDPEAGRALFAATASFGPDDPESDGALARLLCLALTDPAAALKRFDGDAHDTFAPIVLSVLKDRRAVLGQLDLLRGLWWADAPPGGLPD